MLPLSAVAPTPVDQVAVTQGAWAAKGAWGSKARTRVLQDLKEGQEECNICFESAVDVKFLPCKHGSCNSCVDQLRAAAVFKVRVCKVGTISLTAGSKALPDQRSPLLNAAYGEFTLGMFCSARGGRPVSLL